MKGSRMFLCLWPAALVLLTLLPLVAAQAQFFAPEDLGRQDVNLDQVWEGFLDSWKAFAHWQFMLQLLVGLLLAAVLGGLVAYHPKSFGKAASLEEVEQPKTFIMYAVVAAMVGEIVQVNPPMALVVFGIGGLLRFRTDVGAAKDTGRVILVTMMGLACGLDMFPLAVLGTAFGWVLVYFLEARPAYRIMVKGLDAARITPAAEAYKEVLIGKGCRILRERKNFAKGQVAFVFRAPADFSREELEGLFEDVAAGLKGAVDWETT